MPLPPLESHKNIRVAKLYSLSFTDHTRKKLTAEKTDLEKQITDAENSVRTLGKLTTSLSTQVLFSADILALLKVLQSHGVMCTVFSVSSYRLVLSFLF